MTRFALFPALILGQVSALSAQTPAPRAPVTIPPAEVQMAGAVLPLPADQRAGATVLGYGADGKLTTLRRGSGDMTCLASDPKQAEFHAACYHNDMEPFMARGRALRASGVTGAQVDSVRFREVKEGKLPMPKNPSAMAQIFGESYDAVKNEVAKPQALYVVYIPFATGKTTGLPEKPFGKAPWVMFPGTPKAHIRFTPGM
ncbi:MAG TPA: hypothetical protein VF187_11010 [Gemmatimonadales bacterium]